MKKLISVIFSVVVMIAITSCGQTKSSDATQESCDTISVCGVALDGAMNSIMISTEKGDTLAFGYAELVPEKRVSWMIGDTVTISYVKVKTQNLGENNMIDSVLYMSKGCLKK